MTMLKEHPKGLTCLFFTEMWERFSYYGMRALLVLYCVATEQESGLGFSKENALQLYAFYTGFVYFASALGGYVADKYLGQKKSVLLGGYLLVAGHLLMSLNTLYTFYVALVCIVLGTGFLKPNISTLVGGLYSDRDRRRDAGFVIFYMGINIGGMLAPIVVSEIAARFGWHIGFAIAAFGMTIAQIIFVFGSKHVSDIRHRYSSESTHVQIHALSNIERDRLKLIFISFIVLIIFFAGFEQAGGLVNLFTDEHVNKTVAFFGNEFELATGSFQSLNSLFVILLGGVWVSILNRLAHGGISFSTFTKFSFSTMMSGIGFVCLVAATLECFKGDVLRAWEFDTNAISLSNPMWIVGLYFFQTIGELLISPISLSFVTKLAPPAYASRMMGAYFLFMGFADLTAGYIGVFSSHWKILQTFACLALFNIFFGIALFLVRKKLEHLSHGVE